MESMINTVSMSSGANMTDRRNARVIPAALSDGLSHSNACVRRNYLGESLSQAGDLSSVWW